MYPGDGFEVSNGGSISWIRRVSRCTRRRSTASMALRARSALAVPDSTDQLHAVVPVARTHQWQAMRTISQSEPNRTHAMLVEARGLRRHFRQLVIRLLAILQGAALDERAGLVENADVTGDIDVAAGSQRQPQIVVGAARAHAFTRRRMPPVLHIAFEELARCRAQQVLADRSWRGVDQGHHVLQLVTKAVRAARLVERRAAPQARRNYLIDEPAVGQCVQRRIRGSHLDRTECLAPVSMHRFEGGMRGVRPAPA